DRSRHAARGGAPAGRLRRDQSRAPAAADVQGGGRVDLRVAVRAGPLHQPRVRRASGGRAHLPRLRAAQERLTRTTTASPSGVAAARTVPGRPASLRAADAALPAGNRRRSSTAFGSTRRETTVPPSVRAVARTVRSAAPVSVRSAMLAPAASVGAAAGADFASGTAIASGRRQRAGRAAGTG